MSKKKAGLVALIPTLVVVALVLFPDLVPIVAEVCGAVGN